MTLGKIILAIIFYVLPLVGVIYSIYTYRFKYWYRGQFPINDRKHAS
jgi:hypothetical protein